MAPSSCDELLRVRTTFVVCLDAASGFGIGVRAALNVFCCVKRRSGPRPYRTLAQQRCLLEIFDAADRLIGRLLAGGSAARLW